MTLDGVKRSDLATLAFTFFALGVTVSAAMVERGVSSGVTLAGAVFILSATSQLAHLAVTDAGGSEIVGVLSGSLVATRFGLMAMSLSTRYEGSTLERAAAAVVSFDPNVALAMQEKTPEAVRRTFWWAIGSMLFGWILGTGVGLSLGDVMGDGGAWGLDAVFPAALLAIIGGLLRRRDGMLAALVGAGLCLALLPIAPGGVPILASALGAIVAALWSRQ